MIKENIRNDEIMKALLKKFFLHFHIILLFILIANTVCFYIDNSEFYFKLFLIFSCYESFVTAITFKMSYDQQQPFVLPYLIALYLFSWYFLLCMWHSNPAVLCIFIAFPFGTYTIFSRKIVLLWCLAIITSIIITIVIPADIFSKPYPLVNVNYVNLRILTCFMIFFGFIFFYNNKINNSNVHRPATENLDVYNEAENRTSDIYKVLYRQITLYFENKTPWKNPDFSIQDLAIKLNTNTTYISRAVNYSSGMNFKTFVNKYRIDYIKNELLSDHVKKRYSLFYIYTSAGFRHQSTFNKAFKQIESMTPSEYIALISKKNVSISET